jgi:hypothetical protein
MDAMERIERKLDMMNETMKKMEVTQAVQAKDIAEHIRRTNILEESLKPIVTHHGYLIGVYKFFLLLGVLAGAVKAVSLLF